MDSSMRNPRVAEILLTIAHGHSEQLALPARLCAECLSALSVSGVGVALMTADGPSGVVLAAGVNAIFAFPLRVGAIRVGVLDLYRDTLDT
jgi:hypothetical protein